MVYWYEQNSTRILKCFWQICIVSLLLSLGIFDPTDDFYIGRMSEIGWMKVKSRSTYCHMLDS